MNNQSNDFNRRDFLRGASLTTLMAMMGGVELRAEDASTNVEPALTIIPTGRPVKYGVIGLGPWAREIITQLGKLPNAPVVALCDTFPKALSRAAEAAPKAEKFDDYKKLLECKEVEAVIISTPTHNHRDIVLAALQAGKHVYCEAPLAGSIEDAKAIALAAKNSPKVVFQSGLQNRSHPHRTFLLKFLRAGASGRPVMARAQWHKKKSWALNAANPEREKEINWRLRKETSTGLIGEIGIHQLDLVSWFWKARPAAVTGFGSIVSNNDGRDVADTVQANFEFPEGANFLYDATLANSFDSDYEMLYGTDAAVMMRGGKAWMFKEVDSPLLGWEVYARKDAFFGETGIVLAAGATNQKSLGNKPVSADPFPEPPIYYALEAFTANVAVIGDAVADYVSNFGDSDLKAMQDQLATLKTKTVPGWKEGFEATVMAIKANESVNSKQRIVFKDEWFQL